MTADIINFSFINKTNIFKNISIMYTENNW